MRNTLVSLTRQLLLLLLLITAGAQGAWGEITELPYHTDFASSVTPFEKTSGTTVENNSSNSSIGSVLHVYNAVATATFTGGYALKPTETVTISFTAYHGWNSYSRTSKVAIKNTAGAELVSYTYNQNSTLIEDVSIGGETVDGFSKFSGISKYNSSQGANGINGNGKPYVNTNGYNPTITMTICGNGLITFNFVCSGQGVTQSFAATVEDKVMNLGSIVITDANTRSGDQSDRSICIDNLNITSKLYSYDYENTGGLTDWTTSTPGRYTPIIAEDGSNHYMVVNQDQRNNNGTTLTNNAIKGSVSAGENFTMEFDMKLGRSDRNQSPTKFTVFAANGSELFSMTDAEESSNTWKMQVGTNTAEDITLAGSGTGGMAAIVWHHYKLSYTNGMLYVTITSLDGATNYKRAGYSVSASGLSKMTFETKRYNANFAFDNLTVLKYANTSFTTSGKSETYRITSEGDLPQKEEGKTITLQYGLDKENQQTKTNGGNIGAFCIDNNTSGFYTRAWGSGATAAPSLGSFYKFTPKFNGKLTIVGGVEDAEGGALNRVTLRTADGTQTESVDGAAGMTHKFSYELTADTDYYLFAETEGTGNYDSGKGKWATFYLASFTFEQTAMNREIKVSDLLYVNGKKQTDGLDRTIPGFTLTFTGGSHVETVESGQQLKLISNGGDGNGTMVIALRQSTPTHNAVIKSIVFQVANAAGDTQVTVNGGSSQTISSGKVTLSLPSDNATATIACTTGNFRFSSFSVNYTGTNDAETAQWLDDTKSTTPTLSFGTSHFMRVPGDGQVFSQAPAVSSPSSFNAALTYTSDNNTIATINSDGTNGQLLKSGEATITATFAGTDYFNSATASYTVSNVLKPDETYTRSVTDNQTVRIDAKASAADTDLTLAGTTATNNKLTFGTSVEKKLTSSSGTTVKLTNNTSANITIETFRNYSKRPVAYLYYEGQEENYSEQLVFQSFPSGPVKGFRVLDIGDPTDPIDLTEAYSLKQDTKYVWENGTLVTTTGGTFNDETGSFTVSNKSSEYNNEGEKIAETLPKITHLLTKNDDSDGYPTELTATSNIYIAPPSDTNGDSSNDTYYTWDMTASISAAGQLDSRWRWDAHGYYQAWMPEYLPILNNSGKTLAGNEGLLVKGDLRYHTGSTGLRMNLTSVNAHLKFPVKAGMEVKIVMASAAADIEHIISNVTTVTGDATNSLYIEQAGVNTPITAYYLAKADGAIEIHSMDKMGGYIKSITLQVPRIHFNEEIITVRTIKDAIIANQTVNTGDAEITYSIEGSYNLDGTTASTLATVPNDKKNEIKIYTTDEGYVIVKAVNSSATGVQPKQGTYRIYMINFGYETPYYDKTTDEDANGVVDFPSLDLTSEAAKNNGGEAWFDKRPDGYDKVVQPITYTMSVVDGSPRGRLIQTTDSDPTKTTYKLSAYSAGTIRVTATTGRISTYTDVHIEGGDQFAETAPARRLTDLEKEGDPAAYYFLNELPAGFETGNTTFTVDKSGDINCGAVTTTSAAIDDVTHYYAKIANITDYGAIRVTATNTDNDKTASFILTVAYPASTGQKWDFYRKKHYDSSTKYGLYIGAIDEYNGDESQTATPNPRTIASSTSTQHKTTGDGEWSNSWTTSTKWEKIYRKGNEQPRWAYAYSMRGDNAFIIEETAGLIIETGPRGFYTDNPVQPNEFAYNHIGLHNNASITIPKLKKGDYIALNLSRVLPNNGAILSATNVEDLAGNPVNHTFTISRSQIDYQNAGATVKDGTGARVIPGYYTFRTIADGDVTFTLADEGYLDVLSVEIYNDDAEYSAPRDPSNGYHYTMTDIKKDDYPAYSTPTATYLKEDNETEIIDLAICNILNSTSVGPADYVLLDKKGTLNASLENVEWFSDGGALYNKGKITVRDGYGKILVRMNNYTAEGRYLIGYTPTYSLTVGNPPHQDYPFTWNFENISGGAVHGKVNNVYSSIQNDYLTWTNLGYETYKLDTNTPGGSLYVPGASLVTTDRSIGEKGTISELNTAGKGCDEFNGLGFNGSIVFKLAQQGETANDAPTTWNAGTSDELLNYEITSINYGVDASGYLTAADGKIKFGNPGRRAADTHTSGGAAYRMDGGNTKNVLLQPQRPFQNGDKIILKGYSSANVEKSGFSFYANANDAAGSALLTLNWGSHGSTATANTESTITYTVTSGDGLSGRSEVYLFRADKANTVFLSGVRITGSDASAPTAYERALTCNGDVTVTIPDLLESHYVYIKSSATPKTIPSNLTAAVTADGLDAATNVYKYKVIAGGNANVTFADGTKIYRIGVTNIMKPMTRVGSGDAWATESRDHAIDYTQTGAFTVNDIKANTVTAKNYGLQKLTVKMNEKTDAMPAETGMVLKLPYTESNFNKTKSYNSTNNTGEVPLFYPPYSATILSSAVVGFGGSEGNLMIANLNERELLYERETGVIDNDGDNIDDSGADDGDYTRFIFAQRYMQWKKENGKLSDTPTSFTPSGNLPVFYRLHLYSDSEASALSPTSTKETLNTLGAYKAYMLIRSGNVPKALWDTPKSSSARSFIGIAGISDMGEITGITEHYERPASAKSSAIYDLRGQCMGNDESVLAPGIYIRNGKKFVIR